MNNQQGRLVVERKPGSRLFIGNDIEVEFLPHNKVAIYAPRSVDIRRDYMKQGRKSQADRFFGGG